MSFYTSLTGLNSATAQLAVTSNNIANVGTSGFKRSRADFGDIFSTSPLQKSSSNIGQGVSLKQVSQEFSQGNVSTSGNSLDLAITGDGFFALKTADGLQDIYTRNGSFTLNDQNNVVNSTGQRLMAASVDSSGKADLTDMNALSIPPKTSGEAIETTQIQLGLNLPADSAVLNAANFDRTNPSTYNKSTALTVYDSGGNGYLATVFYVKTQNATLESPFSKWQTFFFVGETQVKPALQQVTDKMGTALFVNKYGDVLPKNDPRVVPSSGTTEMYSLDKLNNVSQIRQSSPATALGVKLTTPHFSNGNLVAPTGTLTFDIIVDGSATPRTISYMLKAEDSTPSILARNVEVAINNTMGRLEDTPGPPVIKNARFGISVDFDPINAKFSIASGTTGDTSTIAISGANNVASNFMGLSGAELVVNASPSVALRGKPSLPAVLKGEATNIVPNKNIEVKSDNKDFFVTVNGIPGRIELTPGQYSITEFEAALQNKINGTNGNPSIEDSNGRKVSGVTVKFDTNTKAFVFTTANTGGQASIQVTNKDFGLANTEMQFGVTSEWKQLDQFSENGALQFVKNGVQTESSDGLSTNTEWWPIYLDRGELSFDLTGKPVSPLTDMPFETAFLAGGKGALTMSIDFTKSTQYSSAFAVLSQSQDGAPEGELMGLNINPDGLVNATYSNGSQVSLGKIVLANFSSPSGLRQVGDASYLASATSGMAKIGEAGSAGFGSIRAGATERANVDLTQELVDLITAQRNFQANAKAIETSSTMTSAIINIRS
jgi:flagellar hook-basal body protein